MATSLLITASDQNIKLHLGSEEAKPEPTKSNRGRKPSKAPQQKKQPQRGLGVAQLERLRLQEGRKKMNENIQIPQLQPSNHSGQFQLQTVQPAIITEPLGGVPVQYGALNCNGVPVLINGSSGGLFGVDRPGLVLQRTGINHGFGGDFLDPRFYGIQGGSVDQGQIRLNGAAYETSKELSSIPNNISCLSSGRCGTFCKMKKPLDGGNQNIGFNFPKFNIAEKIPNFIEETNINNGLGDGATKSSCFNKICYNLDEGVEVVKVHRKGSEGGSLVMEYDFFPDAPPSDRGTYPEDMEETSVVYSVGGDQYTNSLDLSLRLSY